MPVGIETIAADGTRLLTEATRAGRIIGAVDVSGNGSISVPGFANGEPFAITVPTESYATVSAQKVGPRPQISGTTLSWTYPSYVSSGSRGRATIYYGVY